MDHQAQLLNIGAGKWMNVFLLQEQAQNQPVKQTQGSGKPASYEIPRKELSSPQHPRAARRSRWSYLPPCGSEKWFIQKDSWWVCRNHCPTPPPHPHSLCSDSGLCILLDPQALCSWLSDQWNLHLAIKVELSFHAPIFPLYHLIQTLYWLSHFPTFKCPSDLDIFNLQWLYRAVTPMWGEGLWVLKLCSGNCMLLFLKGIQATEFVIQATIIRGEQGPRLSLWALSGCRDWLISCGRDVQWEGQPEYLTPALLC